MSDATAPAESVCGDTAVQDAAAAEASRKLSETGGPAAYRVPGLTLLRKLGEGAFGEVWLAEQTNTGKRVAVKLYTRRSPDWPLLAREVEKLATLDASRNVVNLLEVGWDHDPPYFVMEHLTGGSLRDRVETTEAGLPTEEAVRLATGVARGLVRAHGAGILHCDLKPDNVLLDSDGEPRLVDFGQSRLATERDPSLGTLFYMAPEQADAAASPESNTPNVRWDVYAFGALLHQLLTGSPPHRTAEADATLSALPLDDRLGKYAELVRRRPLPELRQLDKPLTSLVRGCLQADAAGRTPNMQVVLDGLNRRAAARSRRPYVIAGFLLPLLFALALAATAWRAVPAAVETTEESLIAQKLSGDAMSAKLLAVGVERDLDARLTRLSELATSESLVEALRSGDDGALQDLVNGWSERAESRLEDNRRAPDASWFVTDAAGTQVARSPISTTIGGNFAYRDYYHGQGRELEPGASPPMREAAGLSLPFRSRASGQFMVALSVPVVADGEPVGLLARTLRLTDLLSEWETRINSGEGSGRLLALADLRDNQILDHAWMTAENVSGLSDADVRSLRLPAELRDALASPEPPDRSAGYADPLASRDGAFAGSWLAAFAPVGETGWVAVVQERRDGAVAPVERLRGLFVNWGALLAAVFGGLLLVFWYLLARLRRA